MTSEQMHALASKLARVKSEQNIAVAMTIYHPDIELAAPSFDARHCGAAAVEQGLQVFFTLFPDYQIELHKTAYQGATMLASGQVRVTPHVPGQVCPCVSVPVFLELEFRDARIYRETFFLDAGLLCRRAGIAPEQLRAAAAEAQRALEQTEVHAC
ncbi:MAG TPA: nuclear transport factor 2 family protein [Pseudomonas sp.]|nr:nuclear transport factor 2 family protein [Pseudomonas sp.]